MSRVVSRVGLSRGRMSRAFSLADLVEAIKEYDDKAVYVEIDANGWMVCAGGGSGTGGVSGMSSFARACVRARLAPDVHARTALLTVGAGPEGAVGREASACLTVAVAAAVAPHHELLLWLDDSLLALADMPFLTPNNIRGKREYVCHKCLVHFERPNPLKVHMFLSCQPYSPRRFWRTMAHRLLTPPSLFPPSAPPAPPPIGPAELEALATEWGRCRGAAGHVCVYCGKAYSRKYGLKIHIRTHTGYRPLRCRHCARAFGDPSNLNKHVRLHASTSGAGGGGAVAPGGHACVRCGRVLARRRDLERHIRSHHSSAAAHT